MSLGSIILALLIFIKLVILMGSDLGTNIFSQDNSREVTQAHANTELSNYIISNKKRIDAFQELQTEINPLQIQKPTLQTYFVLILQLMFLQNIYAKKFKHLVIVVVLSLIELVLDLNNAH
jgi:hypothetical protein